MAYQPERGRTLRRTSSNASLLSDCLSLASKVHEYESSEVGSQTSSLAREPESPFRPDAEDHSWRPPPRKEQNLVNLASIENCSDTCGHISNEYAKDSEYCSNWAKSVWEESADYWESEVGKAYELSFQCTFCNKRFASEFKLRRHRLSHAKPYVCPRIACSQREGFKTAEQLAAHLYSFHTNMPKGLDFAPPSRIRQTLLEEKTLRRGTFHIYIGEEDSPWNPLGSSPDGSAVLITRSMLSKTETLVPRGDGLQSTQPSLESLVLPTPSETNQNNASGKKSGVVSCPICGEFKGRPCELKKHLKRHERPYGCTYRSCNKTFGSKNDWKRHENSQHRTSMVLRHCGLEPWTGAICKTLLTSKYELEKHHIKDHEFRGGDGFYYEGWEKTQDKLFWCGFCQRGISGDVHTARFEHIDNHFMGRDGHGKRKIEDWEHFVRS